MSRVSVVVGLCIPVGRVRFDLGGDISPCTQCLRQRRIDSHYVSQYCKKVLSVCLYVTWIRNIDIRYICI